MKLTEILTAIAAQSGVPADNAAITTLLANASLSALEVDEATSKLLTAPRMTMDAAKANPDLKKHFRKEVYDGLDAEITRTIGELELPEAVSNEIKAEESHFKKVSLLTKKVKDLESKKAGASAGDKDKLTQKIEALNTEILTLKNGQASEIKKIQDGFEQERIDMSVSSMLSGFNYATPKEVPMEVNVITGKSILNLELAKKGLSIVKKNGILVLQTSEGTPYYDNNQQIEVKDFVQKSLANSKVLAASQESAAGQQQQHQQQQQQSAGTGIPLQTNDFAAAIDSATADYNKGTNNSQPQT